MFVVLGFFSVIGGCGMAVPPSIRAIWAETEASLAIAIASRNRNTESLDWIFILDLLCRKSCDLKHSCVEHAQIRLVLSARDNLQLGKIANMRISELRS